MKTLGLLTAEVKGLLSVLFQRYPPVDVVVGVVGLVMLALSLFVNVVAVKIIAFVLFVAALGFLYFSRRGKQPDELAPSDLATETVPEEWSMGKKIVFDDLHSTPVVHYEDPAQRVEAAPPQQEAAVKPATRKRELADFNVKDFFDLGTDAFTKESEPRAEFDFLLSKVLSVAREVLFAHTVALFWANREKQQMVLEAKVTGSRCFMSGRRFPIETDVVSQIAITGKPEIITQVNPISEKELLRYYDDIDFVKSFIGAPVYFNQNVVAVLAADSRVEDAYGAETVSMMGEFTKLISALLKAYTDKYDLLVDSEILRALKRMEDSNRQDFSVYSVLESVTSEVSRLVNWDFLSVVLYDDENRCWMVWKVMKRGEGDYLIGDEAVDLDRSVVGSCIKGNFSRLIDDVSSTSKPRYFYGENINVLGSMLVVPISTASKCYGAMVAESHQKNNYSSRDVEVIQGLLSSAAASLEILSLQELVKEYVIVDEMTGTFTKKHLLQRIEEEIQRADDSGTDLSLALFSIDSKEDLLNRYGKEGFDFVFYAVGKILQKSIRAYDVLGRFDDHCFGALLLNTPANDAYLWAEKIRKAIASNVLSFQDKNFSVTVSVGVCGAGEGTTKEELVKNALHVLRKATESGGNLVRVF